MRPSLRATVRAAVIGFLLHALTAAWAWRSWGTFGRGTLIAWIDFPVSLAYMHREDAALIAASLALGGLQWAAIAALLTLWLGSALRRG
jgi:hypothetical protein